MLLVACFILAMLISVVLVPGLIKLASPLGLVDLPNDRKVHTHAIPRVGGLAIAAGSLVPMLVWIEPSREILAYLMASAVLLVFGVWDDRSELGYRAKFFGQLLAITVFVIYGGVTISLLPFHGLSLAPLWLSAFITYFSLVGITNAVNLSDGLDGLAGGTSLLSLAGIALLALSSEAYTLALLCLAICGSIFGFLRYNTHPARIFMGDTGSQFLGFSVGVAAVLLTQQANTALSPVLPLILLGLPILDTLTVMTRRMMAGRSPFSPDKNHFHHRLMRMGFKHYEAVILIYLVQIVLIAAAFVFRYQSDLALLLMFLGFCFAFNGAFSFAESRGWVYRGTWFRALAGPLDASLGQRKSARLLSQLLTPLLLISVPVYVFLCFYSARGMEGMVPVLSVMLALSMLLMVAPRAEISVWLHRALWYASCGLAVYCGAQSGFSQLLFSKVFTLVLAVTVLLALYLGRQKDFSLNPLDLIVLLIAGIMFYLGRQGIGFEDFGYQFAQIMLFLYAIEIAVGKARYAAFDKWPIITVFLASLATYVV